ncbi:MAG: hypothetical protein JSU09_07640 [Bacteroidetes bacterium]|nr:hypothetical protein [Bacteroidota bacterium]
MSSEEFKALVKRDQYWERLFGIVIFSLPLFLALLLLGYFVSDYFTSTGSGVLILIVFNLVIVLLAAGFVWLGIRSIMAKYKTFILIKFDQSQISEKELLDLIVNRLKYRKLKSNLGLVKLTSSGWQTEHYLYWIGTANGIYADIQLGANVGFLTWGQKKLKRSFIKGIEKIAAESQFKVVVEEGIN